MRAEVVVPKGWVFYFGVTGYRWLYYFMVLWAVRIFGGGLWSFSLLKFVEGFV